MNASRIIFSFSTVLTQLFLGFIFIEERNYNYLIIGTFVGYFLSSTFLFCWFLKVDKRFLKLFFRFNYYEHFLLNYKRAFLIFPNDLLYSMTAELPIQIIKHFYGLGVAGQYSFSVRFLKLMPNVIGKSFSGSF